MSYLTAQSCWLIIEVNKLLNCDLILKKEIKQHDFFLTFSCFTILNNFKLMEKLQEQNKKILNNLNSNWWTGNILSHLIFFPPLHSPSLPSLHLCSSPLSSLCFCLVLGDTYTCRYVLLLFVAWLVTEALSTVKNLAFSFLSFRKDNFYCCTFTFTHHLLFPFSPGHWGRSCFILHTLLFSFAISTSYFSVLCFSVEILHLFTS